MFGKRIGLFQLLGFKVQADLSWVLLAILVSWSLAKGLFPALYPDLSVASYWRMGVAGMLGLFASIVLHELSHALVARRYELPIKSITLFLFGGVAEMDEEPASPKVEFLMAIAGPIASFVLAIGFYVLSLVGSAIGLPLGVVGVCSYLALINGVLALFNLLPAFPLDGGRVLRSALWYWKGDYRWATRIAAANGEFFGLALIILGLLNVIGGNFVGGMWWFLIGMFLRAAAGASYNQLLTRRAFEGERVSRFMTNQPVTVSPDLLVSEVIDDYMYRYHHDFFPVAQGPRVLGLIDIRQVKSVPPEQRGSLTVADILRPCDPDTTVAPDSDAVQALTIMQRSGNSRLLVIDGDRLVGVIALKDLLEFLNLKMDLERFG